MTPMKVFQKKPVDKKSKSDSFSKNLMLLANFAKIDTVKLKNPPGIRSFDFGN